MNAVSRLTLLLAALAAALGGGCAARQGRSDPGAAMDISLTGPIWPSDTDVQAPSPGPGRSASAGWTPSRTGPGPTGVPTVSAAPAPRRPDSPGVVLGPAALAAPQVTPGGPTVAAPSPARPVELPAVSSVQSAPSPPPHAPPRAPGRDGVAPPGAAPAAAQVRGRLLQTPAREAPAGLPEPLPRPTGVIRDPLAPPTPQDPRIATAPVTAPASPPPPAGIEGIDPRASGRLGDPGRAARLDPDAPRVAPSLAAAATRPLEPSTRLAPPVDVTPALRAENPAAASAPTAPQGGQAAPGHVPQPLAAASRMSAVRVLPSVQQGAAPLTVEFRAELRSAGSPIVRYQWRLGRTVFSTAGFGVLTFQRPGEYAVELTVTDAAGNVYEGRTVIQVAPPAGPSRPVGTAAAP